jgi:hypothetical protein
MKPKKINRTNYLPSKGQRMDGVSKTIQDDAISVADLLRQHINGIPSSKRHGTYIEDADHDDIDGEKFFQSDLYEKDELLEDIRNAKTELKLIEQNLKKAQKEPKKNETEKKEEQVNL